MFKRRKGGEPEKREPGLDCVVPLVRADERHEAAVEASRPTAALQLGDPSAPVMRFLVGSLLVLYAFDIGSGYRFVMTHDLDRLGIDSDQLHDAALTNLRTASGAARFNEQPGGNVGMLTVDGNLEASMLLLPELWGDLKIRLGANELLVSVPARDVVLYGVNGEGDTMIALTSARDRVLSTGDHLVTRDILRFHDGGWVIAGR